MVNFNSSILLNENGNLVLQNLPYESQLSPIFAFETGDFDKDGKTDFFAGGNFYRLKPEMGRHDSFSGGYFKGLGKGKFKFMSSLQSGIKVKGEVRDAIQIDKKLIISRNNDAVLIFQ